MRELLAQIKLLLEQEEEHKQENERLRKEKDQQLLEQEEKHKQEIERNKQLLEKLRQKDQEKEKKIKRLQEALIMVQCALLLH